MANRLQMYRMNYALLGHVPSLKFKATVILERGNSCEQSPGIA